MKKLYKIFIMIVFFAATINFNVSAENNTEVINEHEIVGRLIEELSENVDDKGGFVINNKTFLVEILNGKRKGKIYKAEASIIENSYYNYEYKAGDKVTLGIEKDEYGDWDKVIVYDLHRLNITRNILIIFAILLILIGKKKGLKSLITLTFTIAILFFITIPLIIKGYNAIYVSTLSCILIIVMTLSILDGFNIKTISAMLGTTFGVLSAGVIAMLVGNNTGLIGTTGQDAKILYNNAVADPMINLDFKALIFAGILIAALGAVMDVSMSIASTMDEIKKAKPDIDIKKLIKAGINVGQDIMGTMTNTLILAYVGSSLHMLLLFSVVQIEFFKALNLEKLVIEILSAVSGSIGLILTIPITAVIAGYLENKKKQNATNIEIQKNI